MKDNKKHESFNIRDFALLSIAISYILGIILIAIGIIGDQIESHVSRMRELFIFIIILLPISLALISVSSKILSKYNQGYKSKAWIFAIYVLLIAGFNKQLANLLFFDVLNSWLGFVIQSFILFFATEITYYPMQCLRKRRQKDNIC